jgi:hypothetical protein
MSNNKCGLWNACILLIIYSLCRYSKGWRYNFNNETWFKDIVHQGGNIYNCKVFNIEKWAIVDLPSASFDMENDFCTMEDFEESIRP